MKTMMRLSTMMIILMLIGLVSVNAQVTIPAGTLYEQGENAGGPAATEDPDLITTGTTVPYLVIPDPVLNPTWAPGADATNTTGINSTFTWTVPAAVSSTFVPASNTGHYVTVGVDGAAGATIRQITVQEQSGASCPGSTTSIDVRIVAQPAATAIAVSDGAAPLTSICQSGTNGSLNVPFPTFTVTKSTDAAIPGDATIRVRATMVFTPLTGAPVTLFTDQILNVNAAGTISNADITTASGGTLTDYDSWGTYALTITQISDKISRKDTNAAAGYFDINGGTGYTATYSLYKTPTTGPIYRLPNN